MSFTPAMRGERTGIDDFAASPARDSERSRSQSPDEGARRLGGGC